MVIDGSALLAVLLDEAEASAIARAIESGAPRLLSAASLLEASIVIESRSPAIGVCIIASISEKSLISP